MSNDIKIREINCQSALTKGGFSSGSFCINPYVGCGHACVYCYARFMKRFTNHPEPWGTFVDVRKNIAEVLTKQLKSPKYHKHPIYIGTVTDPYQPLEEKYQLTRKILEILASYDNPLNILTKSNLILRDLDLLKKIKNVSLNFTINTLDENWKKLVEPGSSTIKERLAAIKKLSSKGFEITAMVGPHWPIFTDPENLFREFKKAGVTNVFTESFNTTGGNWLGVEKILEKNYPHLKKMMREIMFDKNNFKKFYQQAEQRVRLASKKYNLPVSFHFYR